VTSSDSLRAGEAVEKGMPRPPPIECSLVFLSEAVRLLFLPLRPSKASIALLRSIGKMPLSFSHLLSYSPTSCRHLSSASFHDILGRYVSKTRLKIAVLAGDVQTGRIGPACVAQCKPER
jgi:hypothetical protein